MSSGSSLGQLFRQGRPAPHSLEIDQVVGSLCERFGIGPRPPVTIGRYRVIERLGAGGLGIVYRAFDPSLARPVAIKVLKGGSEAAQHDVRLLREAQVLAQIRHHHMVEVFDVGFFEDHERSRFFVAMELVEGQDLRHWLTRGPSVAEIRQAFVAAAQGLAAVHEAGLLHRDFKPSNVLMGEDGSVKVADFGLAAMTRELRGEVNTGAWSVTDGGATPSWRPIGTPPYMSPEQQRGEPLTPASDQFGFCVSLYEAIYDRRPFEANERDALLAAKERGPEFPARPWIPPSLRRLLQRGMQPRPEDRFESMDALGQQLQQIRFGSRRGGAVALGLVGVAAVVAGLTVQGREEPASPAGCAEAPAAFAPGAPSTEAVERLLVASPPLAEAWPAMVEALDGYGAELSQRWEHSCGLDAAARDRVQRCLTQCGDGLAGLRRRLGEGERETLAQGWSLVRALPDVHLCSPDTAEEEQAEFEAGIDRAKLMATGGWLDEAEQILQSLRTRAVADGADRQQRHVEIELAELASMRGDYAGASESLEQIYFQAAGAGDTLAAGRAAVRIVGQGYRTGDVEGARTWSRTARTELERLQPRDYELEAVLWHNLALAHLVAGELQPALTTIRQALEHAAGPGVSPSLRTSTLQVYAELLLHNGRPAEALEIHEQLQQLRKSQHNVDPQVIVVDRQSLGNVLMTLHDLDGAWEAYRESYELGRSVLGAEHPHTAAACISYAWVQGDRGNPQRGEEILAPCLAQLEARLGESHPHVALAGAMAGRLASLQGDAQRAEQQLARALASLEQNFGESHYAVGDVLHELGRARALAGDRAAAREALRRALRVRRATLPEGHVNQAETRAELARLQLEDGERQPAREGLQEAIAIFEARGLAPAYIQTWRERLAATEDP